MCGSERSRAAATYQANRAIFLLLSAVPYHMNLPRARTAIGLWHLNESPER
jgi:hypothetical protein